MQNNISRAFLLFSLFLLSMSYAWGQVVHPVYVNVQIVPPYSLYLDDYTTGTRDRIMLTLLNKDVQYPSMQVRLRLTIKANGFTLKTHNYAIISPIILEPNMPYQLSREEMAQYFSAQNLTPSGMGTNAWKQDRKLPEGMIEFCFEAIEHYSGNSLSLPGCGVAWLSVQKPPQLSLPFNNETVAYKDPLNLLFQWTPRHTGIANVEYVFILKQLWDNGLKPEAAWAYSTEIVRETVRSTSLLYTAAMPPLTPGMRYAWAVQAIAKEGMDDIRVFANNGLSEIRVLDLEDYCPSPTNINAKTDRGRIVLNWVPMPEHLGFIVSYKKKGVADADWFETKTMASNLTLYDVEPGYTYEYRIGTICKPNKPIYSQSYSISIPAPSTNNENCGKQGPVFLDNKSPLPTLSVGEIFKASDFPVYVSEVSGSNGVFSGKGYTIMPSLFSGVKLAVIFNNITINTDRQMIAGYTEGVYNDAKSQVTNVDDIMEGGDSFGKVKNGITKANVDLGFTIPNNANIVIKGDEISITDEQGNVVGTLNIADQKASNEGGSVFPITVKDKEGNVYKIAPKEDTDQALADGTPLQINKVSGQTPLPVGAVNFDKVDRQQAVVTFVGAGKHAFDVWDKSYLLTDIINKHYQKTGNDAPPYQLIPEGKSDIVEATIKLVNKQIDPHKVIFTTPKGNRFEHQYVNNTYTIQLAGGQSGDGLEVYALYPNGDGYYNLGKLMVVSYPEKTIRLKVVPVNGGKANAESLQQALNSVYNPVGISFQVIVDRNFNYSGNMELMAQGSGLLQAYTPAMRDLQSAYATERGIDNNSAYLFYINGGNGANRTDRDVTAFMPRGKQFAYVFSAYHPDLTTSAPVVAHELGHGVFQLKHTFDPAYQLTERSTDNLMDYAGGAHLAKWQWDAMHDPGLVIGLFEKDGDGMYNPKAHRGLTPNGQLIDHFYLNKESILPTIHVEQYVIKAITHQSLEYTWDNTSHTYVNPYQKDAIYPEKAGNYKQVNVYTRGENCNYKYLVIPWSDTDEKLNNSTQVANLVSERTENKTWLLADLSNPECAKRFRESYFSTHAISKAYVDYFKSKNLTISEKLSENKELVASLVDLVKKQSHNVKDVQFLGDILADKLRTYELFNSKKFIVVPLLINTLSTDQSEWHTLADRVFQEAGLADDAILITVPYVNCHGIGGDLGQNYYMPGLAFGRNANVDLSSLKKDHSNTEKNITLSKPVASFILDVFTHTTKKALIYKGTYLATNAIECIVYKSEAVSGYAFNKAIQLYRQKAYKDLVELIADGAKSYREASDGMAKTIPTPSAIEMARVLGVIDFENKVNRSYTISELSRKIYEGDLERYQPPKLDWIDFKEEFLDAPNANTKVGTPEERTNGFYYVLNRPFRQLQKDLQYPTTATVDWQSEHAFTDRTDFHLAYYVDRPLYAGLDVASVGLSVFGFDFVPDLLGVAYSTFRGNYANTAAYSLSVFIVAGSAPMMKQLIHNGKPLVSVARDGTVLFVDDVSDIVLREFLQTHKATFTTKAFAQLEQKSGAELKKGIELALKSYDDLTELLQKQLGSDILVKQFQRDFGGNMDRFVEVASNKELVASWLILEKSGTSHFTKVNLTYLQRFSRLSPEVQTYIAKFTDPMDGKGTLVKFLDDCDDDFVRYLNDPENAIQVRGFLAHKPGVLDVGDQDLIARMLYDPSEVLDPKVRKWLEYGNNMEVFRKARAAGLAAEKAIRTELADPNSPAYKALKGVVSDLDQRTIISQAQLCITADCIEKGGYFIPDFIAVMEKFDHNGLPFLDVIIIDAKLGANTGWTVNQNAAKKMSSFKIKSVGTGIIKGKKIELFKGGETMSKSRDFLKISPNGNTYIIK